MDEIGGSWRPGHRGRISLRLGGSPEGDPGEIPRFALLNIAAWASFLRKRESTGLGPRFPGGDERLTFNSMGGPQGH
jgi:hypothetical protein